MDRLFTTIFMNDAEQNWGLGQGAGLFAMDFSVVDSSMYSPMYSIQTDTGKVPPNRKSV